MDGIGGMVKSQCRRSTLSRKVTVTCAQDVLSACKDLRIKCIPYTEESVKRAMEEFGTILEQTQKIKDIQRIHHLEVTGEDTIDVRITTDSNSKTSLSLAEDRSTIQPMCDPIRTDQYVAVGYTDTWYPCRHHHTKGAVNLCVSFMRRADASRVRWPEQPEVEEINESAIMGVLAPPLPKGSTRLTFEFESEDVNRMNLLFQNI